MTDEQSSLSFRVQAAGIPKKLAPTIGICVDHRRRNRCEESLAVRDIRATRERDETNSDAEALGSLVADRVLGAPTSRG